MEGKGIYIIATVGASVAFILMIAVMLSTDWMNACMDYKYAYEQLVRLDVSNEDLQKRFLRNSFTLNNSEICLQQGLFQLNLKLGTLLSVSIPMDMLPGSAIFCAMFLTISILSSFAAVLTNLIILICKSKNRELMKKTINRSKITLMFLVNAGWTATLGLISYAAGFADTVHNPQKFIKDITHGASRSVENQLREGNVSSALTGYIGLSNFNTTHIQESMNAMIKGLDPMFGYAFIVGCIAPMILIISCIVAAIARNRLIALIVH